MMNNVIIVNVSTAHRNFSVSMSDMLRRLDTTELTRRDARSTMKKSRTPTRSSSNRFIYFLRR